MKQINSNKKTEMISIRCTKETKKKLEEKAERMGISSSRLLDDSIEAILKRRSRGDKGKARALVEIQETINHMIRELGNDQSSYKEQLLGLMGRMAGLWQF